MAATIHGSCTCTVCTRICVTIDQIFDVLDIHGWLLESYVVDFFQDKLWNRLPRSWRLTLEDTSPEEFGMWLAGDISYKRVWPLSLLALRQVTSILQLNRNHELSNSLQCCRKSAESASTRTNNKRHTNGNLPLEKYSNLFKKHVKKKKRYEIEKIAQICAECAHQSSCTCIVDCGAGMGHLARVLTFQYGLNVMCIEQDPLLLAQAKKCDEELLMSIQKHLINFSGKKPQHISSKLQISSYMDVGLLNHIQEEFRNNFNMEKENEGFGLVGLHPCGDLAATLLKLYSLRPEPKFICIVGCCYMKLTLGCNPHSVNGYPLSKYLLNKNHKLSYTALEVACHAIEKHCDKLKTGHYEDLIVHAYRAALETILIEKNAWLRRTQLKNVKVSKNMTFEEYCLKATHDLKSQLQLQHSDIHNERISNLLARWQRVVIFGALRLMLAPLIETIVLVDRFLFLSEKNFCPILKPVFDARQSPRNFVLISVKENDRTAS